MTDTIICPINHVSYKLPSSAISNRDSGWDFFIKVVAKQWDFEFFKVHQNAISKTRRSESRLNNEYKDYLQEIIENNMVPITLLDYIEQLKDKKWVKKKRKLNIEKEPSTVASQGTVITNNINNVKEQIDNDISIGKRRKLRPDIRKDTNNNSEERRSLSLEESNSSRSLSLEESNDSKILSLEENNDSRSVSLEESNDSRSVSLEENNDNRSLDSLEESSDSGSLDSQENDDSRSLDFLDNVDNPPKTLNYYHYLVGNGMEKWSTRAEEVPDVIFEELNISKILQQYREDSVIASRRLLSLSECRILSLVFIFPFSNQSLQNSFTQSCKQHHPVFKKYAKPLPLETVPEDILKWCNRIDASHDLNNDDRLKQTMTDLKEELEDSVSEANDIHLSIIRIIVKEIKSWNFKNTEDDFVVYLYFFIDEIFSITRSPLVNVHKTIKHSLTESCYKSDTKLIYEYKKDQKLNLCAFEVNSNFIEIHLEMKSMINKLIEMNVDDPVVYGLLIQGFDCQVLKMTLSGDGFYFCSVIHFFRLPRDVSDIMIVPKVTSFFISLKNELDQLVTKIQNKKEGSSSLLPWTRPSCKLPYI